ncbi:MAG TPA: thioredoxin family protein [Sunxiuqinia sp.]|nr:thioredoxin family protein [Sunxiuqinia sp.]
MFKTITTIEEYNKLVDEELAMLVYFSTNECNVCKVLKPKVGEMILENFPEIKLCYVNLNNSPEIAAQQRIFTAPTLQVIFDRREFIRKSRNFGLDELKSEVSRPYQLMFS